MSVRTEKVASLIKEEIGTIFQRNFSMQEYGLLTVTDVQMSPDLKVAKIYISVFGDSARKERTLGQLEEQKSFVRSLLGHSVRLKFTPSLMFFLDDSLDRAMKIENIINKIHRETGPKDTGEE